LGYGNICAFAAAFPSSEKQAKAAAKARTPPRSKGVLAKAIVTFLRIAALSCDTCRISAAPALVRLVLVASN